MKHIVLATILLLSSFLVACENSHEGESSKAVANKAHENTAGTADQLQSNQAQLAPDFALKNANGETIRLSDFRGKLVLVDFWATWCGPCRMEIPGFVKLYNQYKDKGLVIIGVSLDQNGWDAVNPFVKEFNIPYPIVIATHEVTEAYGGIPAIPTTFIISPKGEILEKVVGFRPHEYFEKKIKANLPS
ncbi:MAG: TlpA family protein disulfide reductase [Calditrichaeota bacterium]|nr:MAG: TlpA family protein disulfide reductase [Calditrichota bacterium]